ncbi:MAG: hypothetical protein ACPGVD_04760 [Flavobacteriales bacterium]
MELNSHIEDEIVKVLGYFDYFKFPLTSDEIHKFISIKISEEKIAESLKKLVEKREVYLIDGCYLMSDASQLVERKKKGYDLSRKRIKRAKTISKVINWFPFVRMVAISGSLSKGYADKTTDIDYFIITKDENLWTSRTLLHILKKLTFLVNLQHSFCMNYFIGSEHLELEEKNYFTAVELLTLIPLRGKKYYEDLMSSNNWTKEYLPNAKPKLAKEKNKFSIGIKWIQEKVLASRKLNTSLMNFTDKRWRKKWEEKGYPMEEYDLAFKTKLYVSKNHSGNFQKKVLNHINELVENSKTPV